MTLTPEPNAVSVRVLFVKALEAEGLLTDDLQQRLADPDTPLPDDEKLPMLLAISDNGTEMRAGDTRKFMALLSIAQHFGRPSTPTDQAWIETLWGHLKWEHPHLMTINDPAILAGELERLRQLYNSVRLHEAIGYVTPNDEHEGRGDAIRAARITGLEIADEQRRHWHRTHRGPTMTTTPTTITNNKPPTTAGCGLNQPTKCRVKSETPHPPQRRCVFAADAETATGAQSGASKQTQRNATQRNATQRNATQRNATQRNAGKSEP